MIIQVGKVLVSSDILTERFCCDLSVCHGMCCVEGDAGAPVTLAETESLEASLPVVYHSLSPSGQEVIDKQGVAYCDAEGEMVTSIVGSSYCVFACQEKGCWLCSLERAFLEGHSKFRKPISCALYPIRATILRNGCVALNYHRWDICASGEEKGKLLDLPLYKFLREPLTSKFGGGWYAELEHVAKEIKSQGLL